MDSTELAPPRQTASDVPLAVSAVRGSMWVTMSVLVTQVAVFVISVVLARLLTPADLGLVEISISLGVLINLAGEYGLSAEIIQRKNLTLEYLSTAFWANIVIGLGVSLLGTVLAPIMSLYFETPGAGPVLSLTMLGFLANAFGVVQRSYLIKEMAFDKLNRIEVVAMFVFVVTSTVLALAGTGVYSYVLGWLGRTVRNCFVPGRHYRGWKPAGRLRRHCDPASPVFWIGPRTVAFEHAHAARGRWKKCD